MLIPAEQILPDTADTLAPLGSFMLAWCGHEVKAKVSSCSRKSAPNSTLTSTRKQVFVITTTELISASVPLAVPQPDGDPAELTAGWRESSAPKMAIGDEAMDRFTSKAADPKVTTLQATHQSSELVLRQLIDAFISELASTISGDKLTADPHSRERCARRCRCAIARSRASQSGEVDLRRRGAMRRARCTSRCSRVCYK